MELKKVHKQDRVRNHQKPYPTTERCRPLSGLERNALASLVHFVTHTQQSELGMQVHCVGAREGLASFRSGVGFLMISNPVLFVYFFSAPSLLEMKFFQKLFPPS